VYKGIFTGFQDERIATLYPFLYAEEMIRLKTEVAHRTAMGHFGILAVLPSTPPIVEILVHK
jgi:hypothetical protein